MNKTIRVAALSTLVATASFTANAVTIYVTQDGTGDGSSWETAMGDLQTALDAATAGDQIWVAAGTYKPTTLIKSNKATSKAFMLVDGVSMYGGFKGDETSINDRVTGQKPWEMINETILDADDDVADSWVRALYGTSSTTLAFELDGNYVTGTRNNSAHVLYCPATFSTPTDIDGFTLKGGNAAIWQAKAAGGALYALGTVNLRNCLVKENSAYFTAEANDCNTYGGAVYLNGAGSITDCRFVNNYSHSSYGNGIGGAIYAKGAEIARCEFVDCVGLDGGGAVYLDGGKLSDCTFTDCYGSSGGAVYNNGGVVSDITVAGCRGLMGGAVYNRGTLTNMIATNCYADALEYGDDLGGKGGALYNREGDASGCVLTNCESWCGGGAAIHSGRLINSTVLNNSIRYADASSVNILVENQDMAEVLNTINDPETAMSNFVAPTDYNGLHLAGEYLAGDWSLAKGSEFIDAGEEVEGFTSGVDAAGNPRLSGKAIDRGAYEFVSSEPVVTEPSIILTFVDGTTSARIGTGGGETDEFTIDWGNGEQISYTGQNYYTHDLEGNTVKIYGDMLVLLYANSQNLASVDVSNAKYLQRIQVQLNPELTTLTLGSHPLLDGIYAAGTAIESLDVTGCPAIKVLDIHESNVGGEIDLSAMTLLSKVDIADNRVTSLILPKHSKVYDIDCARNQLTSLDVTGLNGLDELSCSENQLTELDLTGLIAVSAVYLDGNKVTSLDLSSCENIEKIMAADNLITDIDLSVAPTLSGVYLQGNKLTSLDVSKNDGINWLNVGQNDLSDLDVSMLSSLRILIANDNNLSDINVKSASWLSSLDLSNNKFESIDLTGNAYLSQLHLEGNKLSDIDLSNNKYVYGLYLGDNLLTELDITANTYINRLEVQRNGLTALDLSKNTGLQSVILNGNEMQAEAIDALIAQLPDVNSVSITPETADFIRKLNISDMPGTDKADVAAAQDKGWIVTAESSVDQIGIDSEREVETVLYHDLAGRRVISPAAGQLIIRTVKYTDGTTETTKIVVR